MKFEWVGAKRQPSLEKHDIDFLRLRELFDGRPMHTIITQRHDKDGYVSTGLIDDRFYTVVWVWRGATSRTHIR